jgi:hypothetical protein
LNDPKFPPDDVPEPEDAPFEADEEQEWEPPNRIKKD